MAGLVAGAAAMTGVGNTVAPALVSIFRRATAPATDAIVGGSAAEDSSGLGGCLEGMSPEDAMLQGTALAEQVTTDLFARLLAEDAGISLDDAILKFELAAPGLTLEQFAESKMRLAEGYRSVPHQRALEPCRLSLKLDDRAPPPPRSPLPSH